MFAIRSITGAVLPILLFPAVLVPLSCSPSPTAKSGNGDQRQKVFQRELTGVGESTTSRTEEGGIPNSEAMAFLLDGIPCEKMPERVYKTLVDALESLPIDSNNRAYALQTALPALERLRELPWPNLSKLERVRLQYAKFNGQVRNAWRVPGEEAEMLLLMPNFSFFRKPRIDFSRIEITNYADELEEFLQWIQDRTSPNDLKRDSTAISDFGRYPRFMALYHAYAAAYFGNDAEAKAIVHCAQNDVNASTADYFSQLYSNWEARAFHRGIEFLEGGSPRADVLVRWQESLRLFPRSPNREQLLDYTATLKEQVEADRKLAAAEAMEPEGLPIEERVAYYLARFSDVHGSSMLEGDCNVLSRFPAKKEPGTWNSDSVVEIGLPAVPQLIELLTDRGLTRTVCTPRRMSRERTVLRVQDVALQCIQAILHISFYSPSGKHHFSTEAAEDREKVAAKIRVWWSENSQKPPIEWHLARLEHGTLRDRLLALQNIELIDKSAVDAVALLRRWAETADKKELSLLAELLARRDDLSLLSAIRDVVYSPSGDVPAECVWFLLRHGDASDYRFLLQATRKEIQASGKLGSSRIFGPVAGGVQSSRNPMAVPILVDLLDQREISGGISKGTKTVSQSCADRCMEALIRLTEHNEGYVWDDPANDRNAAIDRWIQWWKNEGQAAYVQEHHEVLQVLEEGGGPQRGD